MADTVTTKTIFEDGAEIRVRMTCVSDGSGEAAVAKIDKSALFLHDGVTEPTALDLAEIRWASQGFASARLYWDHTADDTIMILSGNGFEDFGGIPNRDPRTSGGTGDVLMTTNGAVAGATYDITARFIKRG